MEKIYFKNRFISICESPVNRKGAMNINYQTVHDLNIVIYKFLANNHISSLHIFGKKPKKILKKIKTVFHYIKAAGGVVVNNTGEILLIRRRGKWDLPKGKKEKKEDIELTAIREVCEECGLNPELLKIENFIDNAFHIYEEGPDFILKRTSWFVMKYSGTNVLIPQTEEDITKAKWVKPEELPRYLKKTFLNITVILEKYLKSTGVEID